MSPSIVTTPFFFFCPSMTNYTYVRCFSHLVIFLEQNHILKSMCNSSDISVFSVFFFGLLVIWTFCISDILGNLCINCRDKLRLWVVFSSSWEDLLSLLGRQLKWEHIFLIQSRIELIGGWASVFPLHVFP